MEWLLDHAPVGRSWCLVHATHMTKRETSRLAASGAVAGLCPVTEANLGDGVFPAEDYLAAGGRYGIGTDSNVHVSAPDELRTLEYAQRLTRRARNLWPRAESLSTGRALFDGALPGGTQALGQEITGIRTGASVDLLSLDANDPALAGRAGDTILDSWIFAGAAIDCVWRRGEKLVSAGRHRARDAVTATYRRTIEGLLA